MEPVEAAGLVVMQRYLDISFLDIFCKKPFVFVFFLKGITVGAELLANKWLFTHQAAADFSSWVQYIVWCIVSYCISANIGHNWLNVLPMFQEMSLKLAHYGASTKKTSHLLRDTWLSWSVITLITSNVTFNLTLIIIFAHDNICFCLWFHLMHFFICVVGMNFLKLPTCTSYLDSTCSSCSHRIACLSFTQSLNDWVHETFRLTCTSGTRCRSSRCWH